LFRDPGAVRAVCVESAQNGLSARTKWNGVMDRLWLRKNKKEARALLDYPRPRGKTFFYLLQERV